MSQNQAIKFSIIPVIFTISVAAVAQRLTHSDSEHNLDKTQVYQSAIGPQLVKSQTETPSVDLSTKASVDISAGNNSSSGETEELSADRPQTMAASADNSPDSQLKLTELTHQFYKVVQKYLQTSPSFTSRLAVEERNSQRQMQPGSAQKIEAESDSNDLSGYLAVFNLNPQLNDLQSSQSPEKQAHPAQSEALFLSLISTKKTAWKFFVDRADRMLVQDVNHSESTQVNSPSSEKPKATLLAPAEVSPPLKTVAVEFNSIQSPRNLTAKNATDRMPTELSVESLLLHLFGTPDSPGALAIGAAEGTRTTSGQVTSSYWGHSDPGNGVQNMGTFSYQHGAASPRQADWRQLKRLQGQVEDIIQQAEEKGVTLSALDLVAGADLLNQSPAAGMSYVYNLKKARDRGLQGIYAVLDARVMSFVNPNTGVLEAAGFGNSWEMLRYDQWRRLVKLDQTLQYHDII